MRQSFGQIRVAACSQLVSLAVYLHGDIAFHHKNEALGLGAAQFAASFKLGGVLRELGANSRTRMHDGHALFHSRQRCCGRKCRQ